MAVCIAVIGKDNSPQFIACNKPDLELQFHYKVHTSLDVVEEKLSNIASSENRKLYLGLLHSTEEHKIYGYATNTKIKFIIVVETNTSLRDNDIQIMFRKLHSSYVDIVSNPFYIPGDPLVSRLRLLISDCSSGEPQEGLRSLYCIQHLFQEGENEIWQLMSQIILDEVAAFRENGSGCKMLMILLGKG